MSHTPVIDSLNAYSDKARARFHMPGHKGRMWGGDWLSPRMDVTELDLTDDLLEPRGFIARLSDSLSELFASSHTLISCGGATLAVRGALSALCGGGELICDRVCHISAVYSMALFGITPRWAYPAAGGTLGADRVDALCARYPDAKAVFITSPDYRGVMRDVAAISRVCRDRSVRLIVDNSHGSHLRFHDGGELHPLAQGADAVIDSCHKTLPALTGSALLHLGQGMDPSPFYEAFRINSSTSPSFLLLSGLDAMCGELAKDGVSAHARLYARLEECRDRLSAHGYVFGGGLCDPYRLCLDTHDPDGLYSHLAGLGVVCEYADKAGVICIPSICNTDEDFALLEKGVLDYPSPRPSPRPSRAPASAYGERDSVMSVREAVFAQSEQVSAGQAAGRIASKPAAPYPPGVALVMPGEVFTKDDAALLGEDFLVKAVKRDR